MLALSIRYLGFVSLVPACIGQASYDLLLKGGHVIDPKNGIDAVRDVAIQNGKIAEVAVKRSSTSPASA